MVRLISEPTLANLDYAAYINNPLRYDIEKFKPKKPKNQPKLEEITYQGVLLNPVNTLAETPLTKEETNAPFAWAPIHNALWESEKVDFLAKLGSAISAEKWADPDIFKPYQEVVSGFIHQTESGPEIWVKIEFSPWVKFIKAVSDEDEDGFKEIYGKLNLEKVKKEVLEKTLRWIRKEYMQKLLNYEQIIEYMNVLASYWYPSLNTDLVDMTDQTKWPNSNTEKKIRKKLKKFSVENPVTVIRGDPHGKLPIYNVFLVKGMRKEKETDQNQQVASTSPKTLDTAVSKNIKQNQQRFLDELKRYKDYPNWEKSLGFFINAQKNLLSKLPESQKAIQGKGDWLFFRGSLDYTTAGDMTQQENSKNPIPHLIELKRYFDSLNINLLFVPIPTKVEIYYDQLGPEAPKNTTAIIHPWGRHLLKTIQASGIEVIDLLPHFLAAKAEDDKHKENVYQYQDTHWSNRGIQITAQVVAERIKQYAWYNQLGDFLVEFTTVDTSFSKLGDIVDKLPESDKTKYHPAQLQAVQVRKPDGNRQRGDRSAPIMLIGDSYTGVYELIDVKSAGVGSHIAAKTKLPVDIITSWGGGPLVRNKMMRARHKDMPAKRLVIYIMTARHLYDYKQRWEPLKVPTKKPENE